MIISNEKLLLSLSLLAQSGAEKGVASDKERGRTPAQNNEQVDFSSLRKQAERANDVIGGGSERSGQGSSQDSSQDCFTR